MGISAARILFITACLCLSSGCSSTEDPEPVSDTQSDATDIVHALFNAQTRYEYPDVVKQLEAVVEQSPDDVDSRLALVYGYLKSGRYDDARLHTSEAVIPRDRLGNKNALWLAAMEARIADSQEQEVTAWRRVVELQPDDRWAWYELAIALAVIEEYEASADAAAEAARLETDPAKWEASWLYYMHAKALFRSGQYEEAVAAAKAGSENKTTWRSTFFRMALAQIAAGDTHAGKNFVDEYRQISATEGRINASYTEANIALFFYELRDFKQAIEHARIAYEMDPSSYQSWALAYGLAEDGQVDEALDVIEKTTIAYPDDPHVAAAHAWILFRSGRLEEAKEAAIEAQSKAPRKISYIGQILATIESAIANPSGDEVPLAPWLG